jgi:NADH:ubiquinone oxidoreductase subunit 6 (subunit J)
MLILKQILSSFIIISAIYIISLNHPVYSVFALVFAFINASIYLLTLGFEFLGLLYITVYVGAILILFLFVLLSFDLSFLWYKKVPFNFNNIILLSLYYYLFIDSTAINLNVLSYLDTNYANYFYIVDSQFEDIRVFGNFLYTNLYLYTFLISIILLVVMIGVIIINLENNPYKLQQNYKSRKLCKVLQYNINNT